MDSVRKIVKTRADSGSVEDSEKIKQDLDRAMVEYEKVKKLVDYFVLGLFMVVIMYTLY